MNGHLCPILLALSLVAGCATQAETRRDPFDLAARPQVYLVHFDARTPFLVQKQGAQAGAVLIGGVAGAAIARNEIAESEKLQQKLGLEDPAPYLKDRLSELLRRDLGLTNLRAVAKPSDLHVSESRQSSSGPPPEAVIEIITQHWGMEEYRMKYYASARLVDLSGGTALLSTRCTWVVFDQVDRKDLPQSTGLDAFGRYDPALVHAADDAIEQKLFTDNGALLKQNLRKAAELCADKIARTLIGKL